MNLFPAAQKFFLLFSVVLLTSLCLGATSRANLLLDGSFEIPVVAAYNWTLVDDSKMLGWQTTASDHKIEIWSTSFLGVTPDDGKQFVELDANMQSTLYQDVSGVAAGEAVSFELAHRGRQTTEAMRFVITDLGASGIYGAADNTVLFSKIYSDGTGAWSIHSSATESAIYTKGNTIRVSLESLVPGSVGNLVDDVSLNANTNFVPEPGTWAALSLLCLASFGPAAFRRLVARKA